MMNALHLLHVDKGVASIHVLQKILAAQQPYVQFQIIGLLASALLELMEILSEVVTKVSPSHNQMTAID